MNKALLLISLSLIAPHCYAMDRAPEKKEKKKVHFNLQPQVQTYKKEKQDAVKQEQPQAENSKTTVRARIGDAVLGSAMLWAGPFAIAMAIKNHGNNNVFFNVVSGGALLSGLVVTLAGFKKIESALWPKA